MTNRQTTRTNFDAWCLILKTLGRCFYLGWIKILMAIEYLFLLAFVSFLLAIIIFCLCPWTHFSSIPYTFWDFTFNMLLVSSVIFCLGAIVIGSFEHSKYLFYENILRNCKILNAKGNPPKIKRFEKYVDGTLVLFLDIWGIDPTAFSAKKGVIESTFGLHFHELKDGHSPRFKELWLTPKTLPEFFGFDKAIKSITRPYHVNIGMSIHRPIISDLSEWPHGLIAGSTGSGKSVQMKSIIAQFLFSVREQGAQVYLCDLKGGVEFAQFEGFKNVQIYSDIKKISHLLEEIVAEMDQRFVYMKRKGIQKIDPGKHNKDFIFIAIDESSLLFGKVPKDHPDYFAIELARTLARKILKLGRAARISALFGLQRPSKESIDTEIQENIDARICFKVNTIEGSSRMLGHKSAIELPMIPGRGIWKLGNHEEIFQAAYITDKDIKELKTALNKNEKESQAPILPIEDALEKPNDAMSSG